MELAKRRGFIWPTSECYGAVAGFIDYGPLGAMMKRRVENIWRDFYVIQEGYYEIECPTIAQEAVFIASGHVKGFSDKMCQCPHCKEYLRPETAQGMFVDFARLLRFYRDKLPFGAVQIGKSFRNEISPRQGMIRLREFTQAEAEIFVHPLEKNHHPSFKRYKEYRMPFLTYLQQQRGEEPLELSMQEGVAKGIIANEYVAYYVALTHQLLVTIGIRPERLRFRQHLPDAP